MALLVYFVAFIPLSLLNGIVITYLWGWYVTDYFGARPLTVVEGIGLGLVVNMLVSRRPPKRQDGPPEWDDALFDVTYGVLYAMVALGLGWLWSFAR